MQPDIKQAIDFLRIFHPAGPWVLTAIRPDRKKIETKTFDPQDSAGAAADWLEKHVNERNIYFSVNPTLKPMNKKAEREDIKEMTWLHVDVDPRAGEDLNEERTRALGLLRNPPKDVPPPSIIVFSGGGYQGFWRLAEPFPINGEEARYEEAKRFNQQLEIVFGADNCHNVDRIMRLPGTINIPDERKLKKGRTKTLAELVDFHPDRVYPLSDFTPAAVVQLKDEGLGTGRPRVQISGNIARLNSVEELDEWNVRDRVKMIIVQGSDPDNPKKGDNSRSAWLFDVCCQLVRCEVPDEVIYSVVTDPDFLISESVLKAKNSQKYALRQIERAKEEVVDPWLRKLNEKHAVIRNLGGKCRIIEEQYDEVLKRHKLTKLTVLDFLHGYQHIKIEIPSGDKVKQIPLGRFWFDHPLRRQYDSLMFAPGREIDGAYNLWKGFACEAIPGDCSLYLDHMREVLCNGDEELHDYLIKWMANAAQRPGEPGQVAVVLRGEEGTGKGFFIKQFGALWGRHFMQVSDPKHLVGNFNAHLRDCSVLFADEAFYAGDKKHESVLKQLITEDIVTIELKGVDAETFPNYVHLMMASNSDWVVPAGPTARRFFILDVTSAHRRDFDYFKAIARQMNEGGREALLHHLLNIDLSGFNVPDAPVTVGLQEQKRHSLGPIEEWWYQKLQDGVLLERHQKWESYVVKELLTRDYTEYTRSFGVNHRGCETRLSLFFKKMCPGWRQDRRVVQIPSTDNYGYDVELRIRKRVHLMPSLTECRAHWEKVYGPTEWPPETQEEELSVGGTPF